MALWLNHFVCVRLHEAHQQHRQSALHAFFARFVPKRVRVGICTFAQLDATLQQEKCHPHAKHRISAADR
jgi:hypothetical protein